MNPWWNLPFAVLVALALYCRLRGPERLVLPIASALEFFGAGGLPPRRAAADFFGISGIGGLLFVGWSHRLQVAPDAWLATDAVLTSLGLGLLGAWVLARLGREPGEPEPTAREMTMIEVDELPGSRPPGGGESSTSDPRSNLPSV